MQNDGSKPNFFWDERGTKHPLSNLGSFFLQQLCKIDFFPSTLQTCIESDESKGKLEIKQKLVSDIIELSSSFMDTSIHF